MHELNEWVNEITQSCPTLCDSMDCSLTTFLRPWDFPGKNLEWVALSFSRRSSWPRDCTQVSCIVGRRFTIWATSLVPRLTEIRDAHFKADHHYSLRRSWKQGCLFSWPFLPRFPSPLSGASVTKLCPTLVTPWTVAHQAPLSMGFPKQEQWSGLPFPSPGDLPNPGIQPRSPALQVDS